MHPLPPLVEQLAPPGNDLVWNLGLVEAPNYTPQPLSCQETAPHATSLKGLLQMMTQSLER